MRHLPACAVEAPLWAELPGSPWAAISGGIVLRSAMRGEAESVSGTLTRRARQHGNGRFVGTRAAKQARRRVQCPLATFDLQRQLIDAARAVERETPFEPSGTQRHAGASFAGSRLAGGAQQTRMAQPRGLCRCESTERPSRCVLARIRSRASKTRPPQSTPPGALRVGGASRARDHQQVHKGITVIAGH